MPPAASFYPEGTVLARESGDRGELALASVNLAETAEGFGQYDTAETLLHEALSTCDELGAHILAAAALETLAALHLLRQRPRQAARLLAAVDAYRNEMAVPLDDHERQRIN